jgi:pimeloyl-ACP methyl ester carboxylesterase
MTHRNPTAQGLASTTFLPSGTPLGAVIVLHGAGSSGSSHADFARLCTEHDLAALVFDQRGHGESEGPLDGRMAEDVAAVAALLPDVPLGLRGSSMGGYVALAAANDVGASAVVAICPAIATGLARGLAEDRYDLTVDVPAATAFLDAHPADALAAGLRCPLLLMHAEDDEVVPLPHSLALHTAAPDSELLVAPGGDHRSVQHDPALQLRSVRWLRERLVAVG